MASPFRVFRKHQKVLIATLGLMAMIAFLFLPIIMERMGQQSVANPVVVKTKKFGNITQRELEFMRGRPQKVLNFLQRVQMGVQQVGGTAETARQIEAFIGPATEQNIVDSWLLVQQAKRLGLVVSDEAINEFIRDLSEDRLSPHELKQIFENIGVNQFQFFELLRDELLALRFRGIFHVSLAGTTPAQRWDYFKRLKRMVTIEIIPVAAEKFADEIADPGDKTLEAFFEKYKEELANPASPEPGFHTPKRIAVRYFKADVDKFAVPDEEVKQAFDRYREAVDQSPPETGKEPAGDDSPQDDSPDETTTSEDGTPANKEGPAEETPAEEEPPEENPAEEAEAPAGSTDADDMSLRRTRSPFRLTSMLQEKTAEDPAGDTEPPATEPEEPATGTEEPATGIEEPATGIEDPAVEMIDPLADPEEELTEPAADPPKTTTPKAEDPEEDLLGGQLGDMIRRQLAMQKVDDVFNVLQEKMQRYSSKYLLYQAEKVENKEAQPPEKLDFEALADQYGVTTAQTPLISQLEAQDYDIGQSLVDGRVPFGISAFGESWPVHVTASSIEFKQDPYMIPRNRYLFWKTEETEALVPKFKDGGVRRQVLAAWRMVQAREKATEAAEKLAAQAREADKPLSELFAGRSDITVTKTPPFSWMTRGAVPAMSSPRPRPRLSEVKGVELAGVDFMRAVFDMQPGDVGVAINHPQTVAYVVRMVEDNPTENSLWAQFEVDPYDSYREMAGDDQYQTVQAWMDELKASAGLKWEEIKPDQR